MAKTTTSTSSTSLALGVLRNLTLKIGNVLPLRLIPTGTMVHSIALDPQGRAVAHALGALGFDGVGEVRAGKLIEMEVADGTDDATVDRMCRGLLANTVIEDYRVERA